MNELLKKVSEFLAHNKGLPVLIGIGMVLLNFVFNLLPQWPIITWLAGTDLFLHLGVVVGLFGILLGDAL
ncbi:MAG: hypothetical protein ACP5J4_03960 [Anaerolineae bacterium]